MNEKYNENAEVERFTTMLGIAVRQIVIDPLVFDGTLLSIPQGFAINLTQGYYNYQGHSAHSQIWFLTITFHCLLEFQSSFTR